MVTSPSDLPLLSATQGGSGWNAVCLGWGSRGFVCNYLALPVVLWDRVALAAFSCPMDPAATSFCDICASLPLQQIGAIGAFGAVLCFCKLQARCLCITCYVQLRLRQCLLAASLGLFSFLAPLLLISDISDILISRILIHSHFSQFASFIN